MTLDTDKYPLCAKAYAYAQQILDGEIPACKWVRLACERFMRDLERAETEAFPYRWDCDKAEKVMRFSQKLPHVKGRWARKDPKTGKSERLRLEPWQCFILANLFGWVKKSNGMRRFNRASIYVPRKNGKALALDTAIPTPTGWTTMGDIKPGDNVIAPDGTANPVVAVTGVMHDRPCYRVRFSNGEEVVADAEHEWVTTARVNMPGTRKGRAFGALTRTRTTREIAETLTYGSRGDLNHSMPMPSPIVGQTQPLPIPPYTLGVWLGDGHTSTPQVTFHTDDSEILKGIKAEGVTADLVKSVPAKSSGSVGTWRLDRRASSTPEDTAKCMTVRLRAADLLGDKHIPPAYLRADMHTRLALLQGIMDTDGTVNKKGNNLEVSFVSEKLALGVCELLASFGVKFSMRRCPMRCNGRKVPGTAHRIQFNAFRDQLPCFRLKRKLSRMRESDSRTPRSRTVQIVSCKPCESVPVRCIQVAHPSHQYLFGSTMLPTHNSFFAVVMGWWMFAKDDEPGAEVYCGATTEAQAWEVFRPARQLGIAEPDLPAALNVSIYGSAMKKNDDGSRFEPVIGKPGDGASPHCAIVDEYHEHPDPVLHDTMKTGMGAREQPLLLVISTAGDNLAGPCRDDWRECEKLLEHAFDDETKFAAIWTIDEGDDWTQEAALKKANPNWGISINPELILVDQQNAMRDPAKQAVFKTKHLDIWVNARNGWLNMEKWNACAEPVLRMDDFAGQPCWVGIDAAAKIDVFSMVAVFERDDCVVVFPIHFMPEETISLPQNKHMQKWVAQGHLVATPGARTDQQKVEEVLREWSQKFYIQEVAYDPKEISYLMNQIRTWAGFPCIEMTQGPTLVSEPMKELEAKINTGKLRHPACPVLTWMASNVIKKEARGGGPVKYYYPAKENAGNKIDGMVALIMALSRQMTQQGGAGVGFY